MTRDDRDLESGNPSKSFKVGQFDRSSGFFTPVWESKRRIRSESPIPSSSATPSSAKGGAAQRADTKVAEGAPPEPAAALSPAIAAGNPAGAGASGGSDGAGDRAAAPPSADAASPPSKPAGAASAALKQAGPNLGPDAFLDREPDFRAARTTPAARSESELPQKDVVRGAHQRSVRASAAATRVHEQLRARALADGIDAPHMRRATDTDREALAAIASVLPAEAGASAGYPIHLLRRLRRTIHLSTPLPESVRAMIARYGRN